MTARSVSGGHDQAGPEETVYVFDGGVVESRGARVLVGSGGACLAVGGRVSLVDDGWRALLEDLPAPVAVLRGGEMHAETGDAWLADDAHYRATGSASLHLAGPGTGTVEDGRLVRQDTVSDEDLRREEQRLRTLAAVPDERLRLAAEPGPDATGWLVPLVDALEQAGARTRGTEERAGTVRTVLTHRDPATVLRQVRARIAVPPTVVARPEGPGWALVTDYGVGVHVRRGGLLSSLLPS